MCGQASCLSFCAIKTRGRDDVIDDELFGPNKADALPYDDGNGDDNIVTVFWVVFTDVEFVLLCVFAVSAKYDCVIAIVHTTCYDFKFLVEFMLSSYLWTSCGRWQWKDY